MEIAAVSPFPAKRFESCRDLSPLTGRSSQEGSVEPSIDREADRIAAQTAGDFEAPSPYDLTATLRVATVWFVVYSMMAIHHYATMAVE